MRARTLKSSERERSSPLRKGDESAGKRSHINRTSRPERVRLLQPLLPHPQTRRRPATYSRSQDSWITPCWMVVQDDHFETDPPANMTRGLVHIAGSERRVLSHPGSPTSQTILEICIQRGGISIQDPAVWAIRGSPHFYTAHGCGSLLSVTDGNPLTQLPRRLAHSGPVCTLVGSASYATHPVLAEAEGSIRAEGRLSRQMLPIRVGERCVKANRPLACGPKRSRACTSTA